MPQPLPKKQRKAPGGEEDKEMGDLVSCGPPWMVLLPQRPVMTVCALCSGPPDMGRVRHLITAAWFGQGHLDL